MLWPTAFHKRAGGAIPPNANHIMLRKITMHKVDIHRDPMHLGVLKKVLSALYNDAFFKRGEKYELIGHPFWQEQYIANPVTFVRRSEWTDETHPFIFIDANGLCIRLNEKGLQYLRGRDASLLK